MSWLIWSVAATVAAVCNLAFSQPSSDSPVATSCELVKLPERFKGSIVKVRAQILIAFEDFRLDTAACEGKKIDGAWLEYGNGPKRQPVTWCCGDMIPRDPLPLLQNSDFKKFHRYLTAQSRTSACHEGQCYLYRVTATLTGRLDTAPFDKNGYCTSGYGHFNFHCARLVIHSVSDVVATKLLHP